MADMAKFDLKILGEIAKPGSLLGLSWGAAMSASLGFLQGNGYVTRGTKPQITKKGQLALDGAA